MLIETPAAMARTTGRDDARVTTLPNVTAASNLTELFLENEVDSGYGLFSTGEVEVLQKFAL